MLNRDNVEQFIQLSYLYFLTTDCNAREVSPQELEELIIALNDRDGVEEQYLI